MTMDQISAHRRQQEVTFDKRSFNTCSFYEEIYNHHEKHLMCVYVSKYCQNNDARIQIKLRDLQCKKTTKAEIPLAFTSDCLCDNLH